MLKNGQTENEINIYMFITSSNFMHIRTKMREKLCTKEMNKTNIKEKL